jgi:hypothetical protein
MTAPDRAPQFDFDPLVALAKSTYLTRKMRGELFDPQLFGEPAWDILLVLFTIDRDRAPFSLEELAAEIGLGADPARRWVQIVADRDLVHIDGDRVELSAKGAQSMRQYLKRQIAGLMEMLAAFRTG